VMLFHVLIWIAAVPLTARDTLPRDRARTVSGEREQIQNQEVDDLNKLSRHGLLSTGIMRTSEESAQIRFATDALSRLPGSPSLCPPSSVSRLPCLSCLLFTISKSVVFLCAF
jgi:hypothetical protein